MLNPKERFNWQADKLSLEYNLLLQRLYFFLVGTTFIITAFATVIAAKQNNNLKLLAHFLCGTGYYLAFFFMVTNYLNAKVIELWSKRLERIEVAFKYIPGMKETLDAVFREDIGGVRLLKHFAEDFIGVIGDPFGKEAHRPGPHTWIVPLGFSIWNN